MIIGKSGGGGWCSCAGDGVIGQERLGQVFIEASMDVFNHYPACIGTVYDDLTNMPLVSFV